MDYFLQPEFNCCLVNIGDMLDNGTVINKRKLDTPNSFRVACTIFSQIILQISSNQYGGQSLDVKHLGKYLRKSKNNYIAMLDKYDMPQEEKDKMVAELLQKELSAGIQTIQYQINTFMSTQGQSPFVTLFLNVDKEYEYVEEVAMIVEEILKQRLAGMPNEKGVPTTPAFPKLVYVLHDYNCLEGGEYDYITELAVKCSAKRMYPDYISAKEMAKNYEGNVFAPMGCRSFLSPYMDENGVYITESRLIG